MVVPSSGLFSVSSPNVTHDNVLIHPSGAFIFLRRSVTIRPTRSGGRRSQYIISDDATTNVGKNGQSDKGTAQHMILRMAERSDRWAALAHDQHKTKIQIRATSSR
jgi:hypothetical protein